MESNLQRLTSVDQELPISVSAFLQMDSAGSRGTLHSGIMGTIHYFCQNSDL